MDLFEEACELLKYHVPNKYTYEEALNRIFDKHKKVHNSFNRDIPPLSKENIKVKLEVWTREKLSSLAPKGIHDKPPIRIMPPLILVRVDGIDCLIDGGSRINQWRRYGMDGTHAVYILELCEP